MTDLNRFANLYVAKMDKYDAKRDKLQKTIEKLEKLRCPSWIDEIIKPVAKAMVEKLPGRYYGILGPFGLSSETAIHFYDKNHPDNCDHCLSITFRPGDLNKGELRVVDYSQKSNEFAPGTIGEVNGFNYNEIDIKWDVDWLINFMEKTP